MAKSKLNSFIKRLVTTLILVPVVVGCVMGGKEAVSLLTLGVASLLSWEWAHMLRGRTEGFAALSYLLATVVAVMMSPYYIAGGTIIVLSLLGGFCWRRDKHLFLRVLGVPYIAIGIGSIMALYISYGAGVVLWYMCAVWAVDIGGYLFGSTLHGPKLAPRISPNKTWAGLFGGMLLSVTISWCACHWFGGDKYMANAVILAGIITVIAQIGDLVESAVKRHLGLKDSSNLIPGHGGIFDRIDGLIFAAPFTYGLLQIMKIAFE